MASTTAAKEDPYIGIGYASDAVFGIAISYGICYDIGNGVGFAIDSVIDNGIHLISSYRGWVMRRWSLYINKN